VTLAGDRAYSKSSRIFDEEAIVGLFFGVETAFLVHLFESFDATPDPLDPRYLLDDYDLI